MNKISISRFSFSLNIPFLLELCFLAEVTWVEICVSHGLNSGWAVLWHRSTSSSGSQKVWEAVISFTYQAPFFYFVSNQTKCAEMCLPSTNPFLSLFLLPNPPFLLHSSDQFVFKTQIHIFFIPGITHTHTRADSALQADTCWPRSPTPLLHSLFHHSTVKVLKRLSLWVSAVCISLPWAAALSTGRGCFPRALSGSILHRT